MANIQKVNQSLVQKKNLGLEEILFSNLNQDFSSLELIITINDENLNIKELSSYLDFIYRTDGKLYNKSFLSYARMPRVQLEISEIRKGSWEIVIEKVLNSIDGQNLMIIYLVLKYLPKVIEASLDGTHKYYQILNEREDYLEKSSKRKYRSPLKKAINEDEIFENTSQKEKDKLYKVLLEFYKKKNLAASRFAKKYVKNIKLKPKKK